MLKQLKKNRQLNNKGMTLIEVIITIALLALVSGFILSSFLASMRAAAKSRELHRATTVAQNLMEGLNLKSAEELAFQFNYPVLVDATTGAEKDNFSVFKSLSMQYGSKESVGELYGTTDGAGNLILNKVTPTSLAQYNAYLLDPITNATNIAQAGSCYMSSLSALNYDFLKDTDGRYYYYIRNLQSDGAYYNAKIMLDASTYRTGGMSGLDINSKEFVSVPTIDSTYDAVEVMGSNYDSSAILELASIGVTGDPNDLHRRITISITDALMMGGIYRTRIDVTYTYFYGSNPSDKYILKVASPFDNEGLETEKQLRSVYLYYYPIYSSGVCRDEIIVENPKNKDIELYIIKQEDATLSQTELSSKELSYHVDFDVLGETTTNSVGASHITLHTNLNTNLAKVYNPMVSDSVQVNLHRNSVPVTETMYQMTDIKNKQIKDRMYSVVVEIYSSERAANLAEFQATTIDQWFKEEDYLITVTGAISE